MKNLNTAHYNGNASSMRIMKAVKIRLSWSTTEVVILYLVVGVQLGALIVWWAQ
jgi:hypothetical protein